MRRELWRIVIGLLVNITVVVTASADDELKAMLDRVMAHDIKPAAGFTAKVLVPPGQLYDPLVMHQHGDAVWLNDDGKEEGEKGSRLIAIDKQGKVSVLVDADKVVHISAGFDIAPDDFGQFGGQVFALSQPKVGEKGGLENYVIQRIDPKNNYAVSIFCTLPGLNKKKVSGIGVDASFGPPGSPFAASSTRRRH